MKKIIIVFIILILIQILSAGQEASLDVYANNSPTLSLELKQNNLDFGNIEPDKNEIFQFNAVQLIVKSNVKWTLSIEPQYDLTSSTGGIIPIDRLSIKTKKQDFQSLNMNKSLIIASGSQTNQNGEEISLDFKLLIKWTDLAGHYNTKLIFNLNSLY